MAFRGLSSDEANFAVRWINELNTRDVRNVEKLVSLGMMSPDTAKKWTTKVVVGGGDVPFESIPWSFHLRRIYKKFETPEDYVEFLSRTDPLEAVRLQSAKASRGVGKGQGIPSSIGKARTATETTREALGEVQEAMTRFLKSEELVSTAIARGEAYAKIAGDFAKDAGSFAS